jgi:hypothetical protein
VGLVISVTIAPIAIPMVGISVSDIFIDVGISCLLDCLFSRELTWGQFLKRMGIGALTCLISGCASTIAKGISGKISVVANQSYKLLNVSKVVIKSFISTGTAIIIDKIEGKPFKFSKLISVFFGNLLSYGIADIFNNFYEKITNRCTKLWKKVTLKPFTEFLKKWRVDQLWHYPLAEFSKNYLTSVSVYFMDSLIRSRAVKMNWKGSLIIALSMSAINCARTGVKYFNEVRKLDQDLYNVANHDELKIRNDKDQKLINSLNSKDKLQKHVRAPIEFDEGEYRLPDEDEDTSSGGTRIYSTKDSIETYRSQSEKYNYANLTHEFSDGNDQTPTNTTSPEYVHSRSNSNQPEASSSSPGTPINRSQNINGTRIQTQTVNNTNDNSYSPQSNRSNQSNRNFTNKINNKLNQSEAVNETLPVKFHPIICYNTKEQKYTFSDPNEWPAFPHEAKVVGFIGTKKSGRTTAIHSLLFELGYSLNEEQLAKSLLPVGVIMYVLKKHDLIFLDCCDIADSVEDENSVRIFQCIF